MIGNARARIRDRDDEITAGRHRFAAQRCRRHEIDHARFDIECAETVDRVAGVDRQVDDDLLQLAVVRLDQAKVTAVGHFEGHALAKDPTQQGRDFSQDIGDIGEARLQRLLP